MNKGVNKGGRPPKFDPSHPCPSCGSIHVVKYGKHRDGRQRYLCRDCGTSFIEGAKHRHPKRVREEAIRMYLNGSSMRAVSRVLNIPLGTVFSWIKRSGYRRGKFVVA